MKKFLSILALLFTLTVSTNAMSYEQARQQALFLTDKMAYELNLTDDQYEAAYEINLDYLMSINSYDDLYGAYWRYRNTDLSYVLLDWQYRAYCAANYFYRPLYFSDGFWHFSIYARYPHRDYFYFGRPTVYVNYCGGHSWRHNGGRSWYDGRRYGPRPGTQHFGMRDGFNRGDYGKGNRQTFGSRVPNQQRVETTGTNRGTFGSRGTRQSSTRTTVKQPSTNGSSTSFGSGRSTSPSTSFGSGRSTSPSTSFGSGRSTSPSTSFGSGRSTSPSTSFGSGRSTSPSTSFGSGRSTSPSYSNSRNGLSSFGGRSGGTVSTPRSSGSSSSSKGGGFGSRR